MGLIKSSNSPVAAATPFSLADIERSAKMILLRARQQAEQLLAAAQAEGELLREQARAEGLATGRQEGTAQGMEQGRLAGQQLALNEYRERMQQAHAAFARAATTLDASRGDLEATALTEIVKLAVAIARRLTKRQGLIDPEVLTANLSEALKLVVHATDIRVAIHPAQRATLDAALPQLRLQWPNLAHVHVIEDPALDAGGCRVFTEQGQIDADLAGQLDRIAAELLPAPGSAHSSPLPPGRGLG
ncbi:MAG TPA: FliH/SctL family protein [Tepidisphaeraceae bacterium]|jgi:flagellar assembly protein FliH